jgi:hypothetical protein
MNAKLKIFLAGGLGCIAPNIINYASQVMSGGPIPSNIAGLAVGGTLFFAIAGFLVVYILSARDIRDAFYKGVAVPALIISLANGVTAEKTNVPVVPAQSLNTGSSNLPADDAKKLFTAFWSPSPAYAQTPATQGTAVFDISPKKTRNITITLLNKDGSVAARSRSDSPDFKIKLPAGEYIAAIETDDYYKEEFIRITGNQTAKVTVALEEKGIGKKFSGGVKSLMQR